jgi:hypothetical protein
VVQNRRFDCGRSFEPEFWIACRPGKPTVTDKPIAPKPDAEPVKTGKPARTLSYGVANPKLGGGGKYRPAKSQDD